MKPTIICVDDDMIVLQSLEENLYSAFRGMCNIEMAESGPEAIELVNELLEKKQDIALVITDYAMPAMKGDELIGILSQKLPMTSMALLSGINDMEVIAKTVNTGRLDRFIAKPWNNEELNSVVFDVLKMFLLKKELFKRNTELQLASQMAKVGVVRINYHSGEIQLSDQWFNIFNYDKDKTIVDIAFYENLFHPDDRKQLETFRKQSLDGSAYSCYNREVRLKAGDSTWRWVHSCGETVEFDKDGYPVEYLGIDQDITLQKEKDQMLQHARKRDEILDKLSEQIAFLTPELEVVWANRPPDNCTTEKVSGFTCYKEWYKLDEPCQNCVAKEALAKGEKCTSEIVRNGKVDAMIAIPVKNQDSKVIGVIVSQTDITERKEMERRLAHAHQMESIGSLAAGIAHEINTPIQYINDNVTFLSNAFNSIKDAIDHMAQDISSANISVSQNGQAIDKARKMIDMVPDAISDTLSGVNHVSKIISAMKDFSHPSVDNLGQVELNRIINNAIELSKNEWKHIAELHTEFQSEGVFAEAVSNSICQVILNMIVNAAHAIKERNSGSQDNMGLITIRTYNSGDNAIIEISDTGCGIPQDKIERIFDPFYTSKDVGQGTGQGLTIAYDIIVNKHKGNIELTSTVNQGTTFTISIPKRVARETTLN